MLFTSHYPIFFFTKQRWQSLHPKSKTTDLVSTFLAQHANYISSHNIITNNSHNQSTTPTMQHRITKNRINQHCSDSTTIQIILNMQQFPIKTAKQRALALIIFTLYFTMYNIHFFFFVQQFNTKKKKKPNSP